MIDISSAQQDCIYLMKTVKY